MTFLSTQPKEERQQLQVLAQTPGDREAFEPGLFEGSGTAALVGAGRVGAIANQLVGEAGYQVGALFSRPVDALFDTNFTNELDRYLRQAPATVTADMTPDPYTTGTIGQILYSLVGVGVPAAAGTAIGGPAAGAALAGSFTAVGTATDLTQQGVDPGTAAGAALFEGGLMAAGVGLPAAIGGKVALNTLLYGPGVNVAQSIIAGQGTGAWLESQGYSELADRYATYDAEMLAADIVLGAAFGYAGARGARVPREPIARPSTAVVDTAHVALDQRHIEVDTAPGIPANLAAVKSHNANLQAATEALLDGRQVVTAPPEGAFVPKPPNPAYSDSALVRAFQESGYPELLAETRALEAELSRRGIEAVDAPLPDAPRGRRGEDIELARLQELRGERQGRRLTVEEADELLTLETKDRLAAKVAGRRIPGVMNMEARNEAEGRGELLPVQGFADADNFKRVNDELGHDAGDQAISTIGRAFAEALGEGNVFHRGGDEFILQARTAEEFRAAMGEVRARLEGAELVAVRADGTTVSRTGLRFSYGEGKTAKEAEDAQYADKEARKRAGLRSDRDAPAKPPADDVGAGARVGDEGGADRQGRASSAAEEGPAASLVERQAAEIVAETPDMPLPAGALTDLASLGQRLSDILSERDPSTVGAASALESADAAVARAKQDAPGFEAAVACFLRRGA